jgi:hypothetical protein
MCGCAASHMWIHDLVRIDTRPDDVDTHTDTPMHVDKWLPACGYMAS